MRKGHNAPILPQPRDVMPVLMALRQHIPIDTGEQLVYGWRESLKHVPNFRVKSKTNEIVWCVDIYRGHFYHVALLDSTEICRTIPTLVSYLWRMLGIKPPTSGETTGSV